MIVVAKVEGMAIGGLHDAEVGHPGLGRASVVLSQYPASFGACSLNFQGCCALGHDLETTEDMLGERRSGAVWVLGEGGCFCRRHGPQEWPTPGLPVSRSRWGKQIKNSKGRSRVVSCGSECESSRESAPGLTGWLAGWAVATRYAGCARCFSCTSRDGPQLRFRPCRRPLLVASSFVLTQPTTSHHNCTVQSQYSRIGSRRDRTYSRARCAVGLCSYAVAAVDGRLWLRRRVSDAGNLAAVVVSNLQGIASLSPSCPVSFARSREQTMRMRIMDHPKRKRL